MFKSSIALVMLALPRKKSLIKIIEHEVALPHSAHRCCCPRWPSLATEWKLCGAASSDLPYLLPWQTHTGSWQRQRNRGVGLIIIKSRKWTLKYLFFFYSSNLWHIVHHWTCRRSFGAKHTLALNRGRGIGDFPARCLWSIGQKLSQLLENPLLLKMILKDP